MDVFSLGQYLREAREAKEITLDSAETALKIRRHILEGFEQGDFNVTGASAVQIRGFIRNYARFIGLDEDRILQYYDSSLEARTRRSRRDKRSSQPVTQVNPTSTGEYSSLADQRRRPSPARNLLNLLLMLLLGIAALTVIAFVALQLIEAPPDSIIEPEATFSEGIIGDLPPTLTLTPRPTQVAQRTATLLPRVQQDYQGQPVLVTLEIKQRCWLIVRVDDTELFSGLVRPQEQFTLEYAAEREIFVEASNAAALLVTYNGQPQPGFGARGQKVEIRFRPNNNIEIRSGPGIEPTLEFTLTPSFTPTSLAGTLLAQLTPSVTPGPSPTPSNTPTASDTPTITPLPTETPTITATPTITLTPSDTPTATLTPTITQTPSETAIVPLRITPTPAVPIKP